MANFTVQSYVSKPHFERKEGRGGPKDLEKSKVVDMGEKHELGLRGAAVLSTMKGRSLNVALREGLRETGKRNWFCRSSD